MKSTLIIGFLLLFGIALQAGISTYQPNTVHRFIEEVGLFSKVEKLFYKRKKTKKEILDDEIIQQLKTALATIYNEKKIDLQDINVEKSGTEITASGSGKLYGEAIIISSVFTTDKKILSFSGQFKSAKSANRRNFKKFANGANFKDWFPDNLRSSIDIDNISIAFDESSQKPSELSLTVSSAKGWKILSTGNFTLNKISGIFTMKNPTGSKSMSVTLGGNSTVAGVTLNASATMASSRDSWKFTGGVKSLPMTDLLKELVGNINGIPMPDNMIAVNIDEANFTIFPTAQKFEMSGSASIGGVSLGSMEFKVSPKDKKGKALKFLVGISPSPDFKMANLASELSILDDLGILNFGLVLASEAEADADMAVFERMGSSSKLGRGLNFIGAFDLSAVGLDELIGLNNVMVRAVVSNRMADLLLEASLNTTIPIGDIATFKRVSFYIKPNPANAVFSMGGEMEVRIDKDVLTFEAIMGLDVTDQALFVEGKMKGMWNEPFGAKGLAIGDLWMKFGVSFRTTPIPLPELGIAGKLKANTFEGDLMLMVNTNNPTESAIDVGFNEIDIKSILENYCSKKVLKSIPSEIRNSILDVSVKDARLTIVPRPMVINDVSYDGGIRVKGTTKIANIGAMLDVTVDYSNGIDAYAEIDKIEHPPYFVLKGARGKEKPSVHIVAKASTDSKFAISGSATLLGLTSETDVLINDKGFDLFMNGEIFDVFKAKLEVSGSRIENGGSFRVAATMEQDFWADFTKYASAEIDKATKQTQNDITKAQNTITVEQKKIATLETEINKQRKIVEQERKRDLANLQAAQAEVTKAQVEVDKIQKDIDAGNRAIKAAEKKIEDKKKWINSGNILEKAGRGIEAAPFLTEQAAIISANYTGIGVLEASKETAKGVLELAKQTVKGIHYIGDKVPIDMDPRVSGIIAAKESSIGILEGAKLVLEGGKIIGVGTLDAAKWIVENGPTGVINITYAHFETQLSTAHGGSVLLHVKGTFGDSPLDEKFTFSFNSPVSEFEKFAKSLL